MYQPPVYIMVVIGDEFHEQDLRMLKLISPLDVVVAAFKQKA